MKVYKFLRKFVSRSSRSTSRTTRITTRGTPVVTLLVLGVVLVVLMSRGWKKCPHPFWGKGYLLSAHDSKVSVAVVKAVRAPQDRVRGAL